MGHVHQLPPLPKCHVFKVRFPSWLTTLYMEFLLMMSHFLLAIKIYETLFHDPDLQNCHQFPMFQEEITD